MTKPKKPKVVEPKKPITGKRVRITIEVSTNFARHLQLNIQLSGKGMHPHQPQTASDVLARAVLAEARGAFVEQVDLIVPPEWRGDIDVIHDERKVIEE